MGLAYTLMPILIQQAEPVLVDQFCGTRIFLGGGWYDCVGDNKLSTVNLHGRIVCPRRHGYAIAMSSVLLGSIQGVVVGVLLNDRVLGIS